MSVTNNDFLFFHNSNMGGQAPPHSSWKGNLNISYNVGPGFAGNYSTRSVLFPKESVLGIREKTGRAIEFDPR